MLSAAVKVITGTERVEDIAGKINDVIAGGVEEIALKTPEDDPA